MYPLNLPSILCRITASQSRHANKSVNHKSAPQTFQHLHQRDDSLAACSQSARHATYSGVVDTGDTKGMAHHQIHEDHPPPSTIPTMKDQQLEDCLKTDRNTCYRDQGSCFTSHAPNANGASQDTASPKRGELTSKPSGVARNGKLLSSKRQSDGDSPNDGGGPRKMPKPNEPPGNNDDQLLACPFYKNNPRKYRCCNKHVLRDISRLK